MAGLRQVRLEPQVVGADDAQPQRGGRRLAGSAATA